MKCYVCGTDIGKAADHCPCCGEYVVDIIGDGEGTEKILREKGEKRRRKILSQYKIYMTVYKWEDGKSQKMRALISPVVALYNTEEWMEERFARIPDMDEIDLEVVVVKNKREKAFPVKIKSFPSPTFLHIGAVIEDGFQLRILLQNDSGEIHFSSEKIDLLNV